MDHQAFLHTGIDLAPLGLEQGEEQSPYDCTPLGARVIGWTGVDGIHYCLLPEYGETVFAVEPMAGPGEEVQPVAGDFDTFLRLLLDHTEAAIQQMGRWSRKQYENFQLGEWPDVEQQAVRQRIAALGLTPLEDAYSYVKGLQEGFDRSKLRFSREYLDTLPQKEEQARAAWKVVFDGGFEASEGQPGACIPLGRHFRWNGRDFYIPAVYACEEGLVADIALGAEVPSIRAYRKRVEALGEDRGAKLNAQQRQALDWEDPLFHDFEVTACVNGAELRQRSGYGCRWEPEALQGDWFDDSGARAVKHYGLDKALAWDFWRVSLPWSDGGKPPVERLSLTLKWPPRLVLGPAFTTPDCGDEVCFTHPVTGEKHTITVTEYSQLQLKAEDFNDQTLEYPTHYTAMEYTLTPELSGMEYSLLDTAESDRPRQKVQPAAAPAIAGRFGLQPKASGSVGIIFSMSVRSKIPGRRAAGSSLHFVPRETVTWQIRFRVEDVPVLELPLLE